MNISSNTLYVSDLDFTLLEADASLTDAVADRLNRLIDDGILFSIATARSEPAIRHIMANVRFNLPIVEGNGSVIRDLQTGAVRKSFGIDQDAAAEISEVFGRAKKSPVVAGLRGRFQRTYSPAADNPAMQKFHNEKVRMRFPDLYNEVWDPSSRVHQLDDILRFTYLGSKDEIDELVVPISAISDTILANVFRVDYWNCWELLITEKSANKGSALAHLKTLVRDATGNQDLSMTVFGDAANDVGMFEVADKSIAVENADDAIKAMAHEVIGRHDEQAVINYIEHSQLGQKTLNFYNANADTYASHLPSPSRVAEREKFANRLPKKADVLEIGCGSGHDAEFFKFSGFEVTAQDGSSELASLASARIGLDVLVCDFKELAFDNQFDAVWAAAALLHVPRADFIKVMQNIFRSLRSGGTITASFKQSEHDWTDKWGRFFCEMNAERLRALFSEAGFEVHDVRSVDGYSRDGIETIWLWIDAMKPLGVSAP